MVEAPGTAPGSDRLITTAFIAIAGRASTPNIRCNPYEKKRYDAYARVLTWKSVAGKRRLDRAIGERDTRFWRWARDLIVTRRQAEELQPKKL